MTIDTSDIYNHIQWTKNSYHLPYLYTCEIHSSYGIPNIHAYIDMCILLIVSMGNEERERERGRESKEYRERKRERTVRGKRRHLHTYKFHAHNFHQKSASFYCALSCIYLILLLLLLFSCTLINKKLYKYNNIINNNGKWWTM